MEIIHENRYHTVIDDGKYIIKEFKRDMFHLNEEWSILYDGLYNKHPDITPELIDLVPFKKIVMEKVEGVIPQKIVSPEYGHVELKALKILLKMCQTINLAFADYSLDLKDDHYTYHYDLNPGNVIVQDLENFKFKFIDIDSIRFDYAFMRQGLLEAWLSDMYAEHRAKSIATEQAQNMMMNKIHNLRN